MRKVLVSMLGLALLGMAASAFAATEQGQFLNFPITLRIGADFQIEGVTDATSFGNIYPGTNNFSDAANEGQPRATVRNIGLNTCTLQVVAGISGGIAWGTAIDDTGVDQAVLAGIFTVWNKVLDLTDFGDEDVLHAGAPETKATATVLASPNDDPSVNGVAVPWNEQRSLRYLLQTPTSVSAPGADQTITVTIKADAV